MYNKEKSDKGASRPIHRATASPSARESSAHEELFLRLQRTAGNAAVSSLMTASPVPVGSDQPVVARAPAATAKKRHHLPAAATRQHKPNDPAFLSSLPVERLLLLYVTNQFPHRVSWNGSEGAYTQDYIQDTGKNHLQRLIRQKLRSEHDLINEATLNLVIDHEHGDDGLTGEAKAMVEFEYRQTPGAVLAPGAEADLRADAKLSIMKAVERFGKACQKGKEEIRAQIAEEKEQSELIWSFVEMGFSFIPGAPAVVKGLERYKGSKELVGKALEAELKLVQMGLKKYLSDHQTEGEHFIDKLDTDAQQIAAAAMDHVNDQPDAEVQTIKPYYDNLTQEDFDEWLAGKIEMYKKSVGHLGEKRSWEFAPGMRTMGELGFLVTDRGHGMALITKLGSQPYFLDWIPKEMAKMSLAKWTEEFGDFEHLGVGEYKVPAKYEKRFASGPPQ